MRSLPLLAPILLLAACAEFDLAGGTDAAFDSGAPSATTTDADTGDDSLTGPVDTGPGFVDPTWLAWDLRLQVAGGALDPAGSSVRVELLDAALAPVCVQDLPILGASAPPSPEIGATVLGWWTLALDTGVPSGPCAPWSPRSPSFGLIPWDPRLDPAMDAQGLLGAAAYGLVVQDDPAAEVLLVGYASTGDLLAGAEAPVAAPPLPDGAYEAHSLLALPAP